MHYSVAAAAVLLLFSLLQVPLAASEHKEKPYRKSFINPYPKFKAYRDDGDPGEPLFLTPLIKKNKTEALKKAVVGGLTQFKGVKSYSGYLTVDAHYNSNLFFWYFPAEKAPVNKTAPVVLWLQGGPGASSLFGLFTENGPFEFDGDKIKLRDYRWNKNLNLIYIDNPVGTGFSFTDDEAGYSRNERQVGHNLYEAMKQIFELFDFPSTTEFYVTGESYGGKYVPALAYYIHNAQKNSTKTIPLTGIAMGNGFSDPEHQTNYGDYLYQLGLIDVNGRQQFHEMEKKGVDCIHKRDMLCAFDVFDKLIDMDVTSSSLFRNLTGLDQYFNYIGSKPNNGEAVMGEFLQSSLTRRAIHVGNKTFHDLEGENKVEEYLKEDVMDSVAPWVAELLNANLKVWVYNGQLDIIVAYPLTLNYLQKLKFKDAAAYKKANREIWWVGSEIAGYKKTAGSLTELLVRDAGHMAPMDQPKWMFDLISNFTGTHE